MNDIKLIALSEVKKLTELEQIKECSFKYITYEKRRNIMTINVRAGKKRKDLRHYYLNTYKTPKERLRLIYDISEKIWDGNPQITGEAVKLIEILYS